MLYQKICKVALTTYAFISASHGSTYYVQSAPSSDYQCPSNSISCHIYCDKESHSNRNIYDCNDADACYFHCDAKSCGWDSVVNATNANNLYITQSKAGEKCLDSATVTTPNHGNAYLSTQSKKGFVGMDLYAGTNAKDIIIDTSNGVEEKKGAGDNFKGMNIYAATALYLSITIGRNLEWSEGILECPVNSLYSGSDIAPCMIDAPEGKLTDLAIEATDGVPKNVWITSCKTWSNVQLRCNNVDALNGISEYDLSTYPFAPDDDCWWTNHPTAAPTFAPSVAPSQAPSHSPTSATSSPTLAPSIAPSQPPSRAPTQAPSAAPSRSPSMVPSLAPSRSPSTAPSRSPSIAPSLAPSRSPSDTPTQPPTIAPSLAPSRFPSAAPSRSPSVAPSLAPTQPPTLSPSLTPTQSPSTAPSCSPSLHPTWSPVRAPTTAPSISPSSAPSTAPSSAPSSPPSSAPSTAPSVAPTQPPSAAPSFSPSSAPSTPPSSVPSTAPSSAPTKAPSTAPTKAPSSTPTQPPTLSPSLTPTQSPSVAPSHAPVRSPSNAPTSAPSSAPSSTPSTAPSTAPVKAPSSTPTQPPTLSPSLTPTQPPSAAPTQPPSAAPTQPPSAAPTMTPIQPPSAAPSNEPSKRPSHAPVSSLTPTQSHAPVSSLTAVVRPLLVPFIILLVVVTIIIIAFVRCFKRYRLEEKQLAESVEIVVKSNHVVEVGEENEMDEQMEEDRERRPTAMNEFQYQEMLSDFNTDDTTFNFNTKPAPPVLNTPGDFPPPDDVVDEPVAGGLPPPNPVELQLGEEDGGTDSDGLYAEGGATVGDVGGDHGVTKGGPDLLPVWGDRIAEVENVHVWMNDTVKLPEYTHVLLENGYDDMQMVKDLTVEDLQDIGINKLGHARKIVKFAKKLNANFLE
eukprot:340268_1